MRWMVSEGRKSMIRSDGLMQQFGSRPQFAGYFHSTFITS